MSSESRNPQWSDNPYAPQIPHRVYFSEKGSFAGLLIGTIFYGIIFVLFFRCMGVLLTPVDRTPRGVRWGLVVHTTVMFLCETVFNALSLDILSISYVDNREFSGIDGVMPPGPWFYQYAYLATNAITIVPIVMFSLNQWLADGLLLYRCYIIYFKNYWAIALPCLMYLGSIAMCIIYIYQDSTAANATEGGIGVVNFGVPFYSISLSLSILLTLMIVVRLVIHSRDVRNAMGPLVRPDRSYRTIVTILTESYALYTVSFLLFLGPWAAGSPIVNITSPIFVGIQVIAPFLIIPRVINKDKLPNETTPSTIGSIRFGSQVASTGGNETHSEERPVSPVDVNAATFGGSGVGGETAIDEVRL